MEYRIEKCKLCGAPVSENRGDHVKFECGTKYILGIVGQWLTSLGCQRRQLAAQEEETQRIKRCYDGQ